MTLSSFRAQYCCGNLECAKCVCKFLVNFRHFKLCFQVDPLYYSDIPTISEYFDWRHTAYGNHPEDKPTDTFEPLG